MLSWCQYIYIAGFQAEGHGLINKSIPDYDLCESRCFYFLDNLIKNRQYKRNRKSWLSAVYFLINEGLNSQSDASLRIVINIWIPAWMRKIKILGYW